MTTRIVRAAAMRRGACALALFVASCAAPPERGSTAPAPRIEYRLSYDPSARDPVWRVEVVGRGLANAKGLRLELENWGEWTSVDSYYLRALESSPPLHLVEGSRTAFAVDVPPEWSGEFRVRYDLTTAELGSAARENHGLLPYRAPTYSFGFSSNTLMSVAWDDMPSAVERTITIEAPSDWTIATGFAGAIVGCHVVQMPASIGNTVISFGRPRAVARNDDPAVPIEIVQWGGADDVTGPLMGFGRTYVAACTSSTGSPPTGPIRLIVTEPGFGGTRVDGAIAVGCPGGLGREDAGTLHFLAHEIFHDWLGGRVRSATGDESLCWFWEGFTDYLSLWHLVKVGLVSRAWFAERLMLLESLASQAKGRDELAYADAIVAWRDPAIEPLAYQGSALVAFSVDVALRRAGKPGLVGIIRDFSALPGGRFKLDDIRAWMQTHGSSELWGERFEKPSPHTLQSDLLAVGFVERDAPEPLTYIGVGLDREGPFGNVVAVDPEGPAAGLVFIGDQVTGLTPTRENRPRVPDTIDARYRFGLEWYDPSAERARVDLERDGTHHQVWVKPRVIEGGIVRRLAPDDAKLDTFFR